MNNHKPATQRLKSRQSFLDHTTPLIYNAGTARVKAWKQQQNTNIDFCIEPNEHLPSGYQASWQEARLFGVAQFVVALFGISHFVAGLFWSKLFWCEFYENIFFFCFLSFFHFFIFYFKFIFFRLFYFFISTRVKDFLFIFN